MIPIWRLAYIKKRGGDGNKITTSYSDFFWALENCRNQLPLWRCFGEFGRCWSLNGLFKNFEGIVGLIFVDVVWGNEGIFCGGSLSLWIQGSAALNALRVQFGGNLYLLRRYDWIHRVCYVCCFPLGKKEGVFCNPGSRGVDYFLSGLSVKTAFL